MRVTAVFLPKQTMQSNRMISRTSVPVTHFSKTEIAFPSKVELTLRCSRKILISRVDETIIYAYTRYSHHKCHWYRYD